MDCARLLRHMRNLFHGNIISNNDILRHSGVIDLHCPFCQSWHTPRGCRMLMTAISPWRRTIVCGLQTAFFRDLGHLISRPSIVSSAKVDDHCQPQSCEYPRKAKDGAPQERRHLDCDLREATENTSFPLSQRHCSVSSISTQRCEPPS